MYFPKEIYSLQISRLWVLKGLLVVALWENYDLSVAQRKEHRNRVKVIWEGNFFLQRR